MKPIAGLVAITSLTLLFCCQGSNAYLEMERRELASGIRYDSLFLGLALGMSDKDFFNHCWQLNKQGVIREGASNTSVHYTINCFDHPASMEFYPGFHEGKIAEMPLLFSYDGWAPWNKHLGPDSLQVEVLALMEEWFGSGFLEIRNPDPKGPNAFAKVDGNRRISIYSVEDRAVKVDIVDLLIKQKLDNLSQ